MNFFEESNASEAKEVFLSFPEFLPGQWSFLGFWGAYRVFWVLMIFWRVNGVFLSWRVSWNISLAQPLECRVQKKKFVQAKSLQWCETVEHNLHISCSFEHGWHSQTLFPSMKGRVKGYPPFFMLALASTLGDGFGKWFAGHDTTLSHDPLGQVLLWIWLPGQLPGMATPLWGGFVRQGWGQAMGAGGCMKGLEGNKK